ncbi:hypothetical protein TcasGA2_TC034833 [Tribolium castaneum]|uniref:Uncharacterized protein n=1 Tax=Tribolium castaneum TaxID=7070 RepID=A0A139WD33_TRICA|nr:hypothetical protein TcasGA2_TC034833 [Tribolium castaneum]
MSSRPRLTFPKQSAPDDDDGRRCRNVLTLTILTPLNAFNTKRRTKFNQSSAECAEFVHLPQVLVSPAAHDGHNGRASRIPNRLRALFQFPSGRGVICSATSKGAFPLTGNTPGFARRCSGGGGGGALRRLVTKKREEKACGCENLACARFTTVLPPGGDRITHLGPFIRMACLTTTSLSRASGGRKGRK